MIDLTELAKCCPVPATVYRCSYCEEGRACGMDGVSFDHSYEECHHPLDLVEAEFYALARNAFAVLMRNEDAHFATLCTLFAGRLTHHLQKQQYVDFIIKSNFGDIFTAIVESEAWVKANVENQNGSATEARA